MATSRDRVFSRKVAFTASAIMVLAVLLAIEAMARIAFAYKAEISATLNAVGGGQTGLMLDEYEMTDPKHPGNWLLRPGYRKTMGQVIDDKRRANKPLAVEHLTQRANELGVKDTEVIVEINKDGFKGPELDAKHSRPRILTIGDSCTFGTLIDRYSYPRVLEKELTGSATPAEVVNGGVEGYSPRNVALFRIEQFKSLKPEFTTIYIGWNALYSEDAFPDALSVVDRHLYTMRIARRVWMRLMLMIYGTDAALDQYNKAKRVDRNDPRLAAIDVSPSFIRDVEFIADQMQSVGSKVYLVTLPAIFASDEDITEKALKVGHLPPFTDNPYVLAKMADVYNASLRKLAEQRGLGLIDLAQWSKTNLIPRDQYFFDTVHLYEEGQAKIGRYIAQVLSDPVRNVQPASQAHLTPPRP